MCMCPCTHNLLYAKCQAVLNALSTFSHIMLTTNLQGKYCLAHFPDLKTAFTLKTIRHS